MPGDGTEIVAELLLHNTAVGVGCVPPALLDAGNERLGAGR